MSFASASKELGGSMEYQFGVVKRVFPKQPLHTAFVVETPQDRWMKRVPPIVDAMELQQETNRVGVDIDQPPVMREPGNGGFVTAA